uniref:Unannotated protein n=1 Tax=freshwater metagenome TaxID=449393 RepID=A0A6J7P234_9ZZZZ
MPCDAGSVHVAPGSIAIRQIATSELGLVAHEAGGGVGAALPSSEPAATVTSVARPEPSRNVTIGMSSPHNIKKWGVANFSVARRFTQIWKNSAVFEPSWLSRGNISACTIPAPAVIH